MALNPFSWRNADGLDVWFGTAEGVSGNGGEFPTLGDNRVLQQVLNLADMTTSAQYIDQHNEVPKGAWIEAVEVEVLIVAASSGTGTLNVGLKQSDQSTNISDTALVNAATAASLTAGTKLTLTTGSTAVGSSVGTALTANGLITVKAGTAVFQSGKVIIRVFYNFVK